MNIRLTFLLIAVLILFGGTYLAVRLTTSGEVPQTRDWLYRISDDDIVRIQVASSGQEVAYRRLPGSHRWVIEGEPEIPVWVEKWSGTPLLLSGPQVSRTLALEINDPADYGLEPPLTRVRVTDRTQTTYEFHLGSKTPDESNQYARLAGDPLLFSVPEIWGRVITDLALKPPYLQLYNVETDRAIAFFQIDTPEGSVTFEPGQEADDWIVKQGDRQWTIREGQNEGLDLIRTGIPLNDLAAQQVPMRDLGKYGLDAPEFAIRALRLNRQPIEIQMGSVTADGQFRHIRLATQQDVFLLEESQAQSLMNLVKEPVAQP